MDKTEAITILRQYLPEEVQAQVFHALLLPLTRKPGDFEPHFSYHVMATVPFHFEVDADSPVEAEDMIQVMIDDLECLYSSSGGQMKGYVDGELTVTNTFHTPYMTEGDDPFQHLYDL